MHAHRSVSVAALALLLAFEARAGDIPLEMPPPKRRESPANAVVHTAWSVLTYLPNRAFDLCDVVRLQVRAGPGWAVSARATKYLPVFMGGYKTTWVGLPGPRDRPSLPFPVGLASQSGFSFGPAAAGGAHSPNYGSGEFGAGVHVYMIGFDAGFDVVELADFFAGFALVDFERDDF